MIGQTKTLRDVSKEWFLSIKFHQDQRFLTLEGSSLGKGSLCMIRICFFLVAKWNLFNEVPTGLSAIWWYNSPWKVVLTMPKIASYYLLPSDFERYSLCKSLSRKSTAKCLMSRDIEHWRSSFTHTEGYLQDGR